MVRYKTRYHNIECLLISYLISVSQYQIDRRVQCIVINSWLWSYTLATSLSHLTININPPRLAALLCNQSRVCSCWWLAPKRRDYYYSHATNPRINNVCTFLFVTFSFAVVLCKNFHLIEKISSFCSTPPNNYNSRDAMDWWRKIRRYRGWGYRTQPKLKKMRRDVQKWRMQGNFASNMVHFSYLLRLGLVHNQWSLVSHSWLGWLLVW